MRPRPDAAENGVDTSDWTLTHMASMRPRPDAAENDKQGWTDAGSDPTLQ